MNFNHLLCGSYGILSVSQLVVNTSRHRWNHAAQEAYLQFVDHDGGKSITCFTVGVARCIRQGVQMHGTMYSKGGGQARDGAFFYLFFWETALLLTLLRGGGWNRRLKKQWWLQRRPLLLYVYVRYVRTYVRTSLGDDTDWRLSYNEISRPPWGRHDVIILSP